MTYRERRERRAERLREWAAARERRAAAASRRAHEIGSIIPMGQPILVGHHSEKRHRRDIERIDGAMRDSVESGRMAESMESRADEIERQLATAIYDDDPDAIERLETKLTALTEKRERMKTARANYRREYKTELKGLGAYDREQRMPFASYEISNIGGRITDIRKRLERLRREKVSGPTDRMITARFDSECASCGATLNKGDLIRYNRQDGARCRTCPTEEE